MPGSVDCCPSSRLTILPVLKLRGLATDSKGSGLASRCYFSHCCKSQLHLPLAKIHNSSFLQASSSFANGLAFWCRPRRQAADTVIVRCGCRAIVEAVTGDMHACRRHYKATEALISPDGRGTTDLPSDRPAVHDELVEVGAKCCNSCATAGVDAEAESSCKDPHEDKRGIERIQWRMSHN